MTDIYAQEKTACKHSLRYIQITAKHVVGILNRISSLMRRRRYNMEEVSVSFDDEGKAHIIVAIDGSLIDIEQVIHQLEKLHDVYEVYDATFQEDEILNAVYVVVPHEKDFETFPEKPLKIIQIHNGVKGVFSLSIKDSPAFFQFLSKKQYHYTHRVLSLL